MIAEQDIGNGALSQVQTQLEGKVLIVGLGKTGLSCARYLSSLGAEVAVVDSREQPPALDALRHELPDVAVFTGGFEARVFEYAEQLVVSPGVSLHEPAIAQALQRGVPVLGDIELFARAAQAPVVAITGSNGKSTVTSLVGEMLRGAGLDVRVGGNLGTPALELLRPQEPDFYVLELSSFQLETTTSLKPAAAAVLNVSADHMDRYTSMDEYAQAKQRIYHGAGTSVLNRDDPLVSAMAEVGRAVVWFGLQAPRSELEYGMECENGDCWLMHGTQRLLPESALRMRGRHNVSNALAALALAHGVGVDGERTLQVLREFPGLAHRTQWVAEKDGVTWFNDSKGTNVGATLAAVSGMPEKIVLIAGGDGKGADFSPLRPVLEKKGRAVVLIGRDAPRLEQALRGALPAVHAKDMTEAVARAAELAQPGDTVLLSPACASLDMYRNYEHRGEVFMAAVQEHLS